MEDFLLVLSESEDNLLIDWNRINSLIDSDSDEDKAWLKDMIDTLVSNMEERIKNISSYSELRDAIKFKSEIHQIKGVASNFGLMDLYDLVLKAEGLLQQDLPDEAFQITQSLVVVWEQTKQEIITK
ncbi:MAG: Hpt domain-containing protein [Leptospiraceae bacterium]|nr:Hpt domain-containing protein [Leptospiraceae bacterium]